MSPRRFKDVLPERGDTDEGEECSSGAGPDAGMVEACRQGRPGAVLELYRIHWEAVHSYAAVLVPVPQDAEDLAATAFLKTLAAIRRGGGPQGPVRPYLFRAVKTALADLYATRDTPSEHVSETIERRSGNQSWPGPKEHDLVAEVFTSLPQRWQRVLWYVEIEGLKPREAAPLLNLAPNALSALLRRARKGLREAYFARQVRAEPHRGCGELRQILDAAELQAGHGSTAADAATSHVNSCRDCAKAARALQGTRPGMWGILNPGFVATLLSPITAVRILNLASPPAAAGIGESGPWWQLGKAAVRTFAAVCAASTALFVPTGPIHSEAIQVHVISVSAGTGPVYRHRDPGPASHPPRSMGIRAPGRGIIQAKR